MTAASRTERAAAPADPEAVRWIGARLDTVRREMARRIVGQEEVLEELLIALLAEGHCLLVGVPGLAKTMIISTLAELISLDFKRIQFTPDLMPSDITGATIIAESGPSGRRGTRFLEGPIFANVILADEINRTPPKTQAALMEAMEERQVTAGGARHRLERPFFVLATQNPIELEGTYPLPVSQLDRFLFNPRIDYPSFDEEFHVLERTTSAYEATMQRVLSREEILQAIDISRAAEASDELVGYATRIVRATRPGEASAPDAVRDWVECGAGPRAVQAIIAGAKARATLLGRLRVTVEDIHRVVFPALRHRLILNYHGAAESLDSDTIVEAVLVASPEGWYQRPEPEETTPRRRGFLRRLLG